MSNKRTMRWHGGCRYSGDMLPFASVCFRLLPAIAAADLSIRPSFSLSVNIPLPLPSPSIRLHPTPTILAFESLYFSQRLQALHMTHLIHHPLQLYITRSNAGQASSPSSRPCWQQPLRPVSQDRRIRASFEDSRSKSTSSSHSQRTGKS